MKVTTKAGKGRDESTSTKSRNNGACLSKGISSKFDRYESPLREAQSYITKNTY